jgi:hypothetical protein
MDLMETNKPSMDAPAESGIPVRTILAEQNFRLAIPAGLIAALGGAILWAVFTVETHYELGLIAVAIGYLVGHAIKIVGKGVEQKFGYLGACCALLGCALGKILSVLAFYAQAKHLSFADLLSVGPVQVAASLMPRVASPMDLLFAAIAVYEGYKFSFKYRLIKK